MKSYRWLTLSGALLLTVLEGVLFTSATRIASPVETRAAIAPKAHRATSVASEPTGRSSPSKS